jgi:putative tryptophan/tyrosine transport system substrate-binding protein
MKRRAFLAGLLSAAAVEAVEAQQGTAAKVYRLAIVDPSNSAAEINEKGVLRGSDLPNRPMRAAFEEFRRLGYVEGQNLMIERFTREGRSDLYPELARDSVRYNPDVIFAIGKRATKIQIPVGNLIVVHVMPSDGIEPSSARLTIPQVCPNHVIRMRQCDQT